MRTGLRLLGVLTLSVSIGGCAAVFRSARETVHVESTPSGADAKRGDYKMGVTPGDFEVDRSKSAQISLVKPGYEDHHVAVKKSINAGWLVLDITTCVFPV